ncbi:hemicentin-1-like, partial [Antedon mediterranea]|uniref:hemicentin-1-like n=1 Tax=Antedon mediterranea TaxID=105859 RepID=UPI003AF6BBDF
IRTTDGDIARSNPSILTVYYLDQPLLSASENVINEGQSVTFICSKADGDPIPHITWYKDGQTVNTNNPSRYEIAQYRSESVLKIKSATGEDGGRYTCKALSDQFKGEDAKTSEARELIVYYIHVDFTSKDGVATCTAEGNPKPSSVLILQDGKEIKRGGESTATIEINDETCQSNITCYAENEKFNDITILKNCYTDQLVLDESFPIVTVLVAIFAFIFGSVPTFITTRYIYERRIREIKCQHSQYQALQFASSGSGVYQELSTGSASRTTSRKTSSEELKEIQAHRRVQRRVREIEINNQYQEVNDSESAAIYEEPNLSEGKCVVSTSSNEGKVLVESPYSNIRNT